MDPKKENEHQPFLKYSDEGSIDESTASSQQYNNVKGRHNRLLVNGLIFIITSLLWIMIFSAISSPRHLKYTNQTEGRHNVTSNAKLITCGNTTQEARAMGCSYDILLNNWVPAPCLDQDFIDEYQDDVSWAAFADEEMTQKITSIEEMSEREFYYTSLRDHINHCAVMWKKQFLTLFQERPAFDAVISSPGHTDHCAQYLMDAMQANGSQPTMVEVGFTGCWIRE